MLKDLLDSVVQVLALTRDNQQHKNDIRELRDEIKSLRADNAELEATLHDMSMTIQQLAFQIQRVAEHDMHEREKIALRLDNVLLQFERRLPPGN
jgi:hypothetical protein